MMDPVSAAGLAAAIVQFLTAAAQIASRIRKFTSSHIELPGNLQRASQRVSLLVTSIERIQSHINDDRLAYDEDFRNYLKPFLSNVEIRCKRLEELLRMYLPVEKDTGKEKIKKALASLGKDRDIEKLANELHEDFASLTLIQVTPTARYLTSQTLRCNELPHLTENIWYNIPHRRVQHFIGREDVLLTIANIFSGPSELEPRVIVLQGMGGQGKTQTALEYCRREKKARTYSGLFWVDAFSKSSTVRGFEAIAELLKAPNQTFSDSVARVTFTKTVLMNWEKPWIMVLDNYDHPVDFSVTEFLPQSKQGQIIITTRSPDTQRLGCFIKLEKMKEIEAVALLAEAAKLPRNDECNQHGRKIVLRLGYLPLAIDQAGTYLRERQSLLSIRDFLSYYEQNAKDILTSTPHVWEYLGRIAIDQETESVKNVFTTWNMSYLLLHTESGSGAWKSSLLNVMAFLDENNISEELFRIYCVQIFRDGNEPDWVKELCDGSGTWKARKYQELVFTFKRLSLVNAIETNDGLVHISIHPLVADWIKLRQDKSTAAANRLVVAQILACSIMECYWECAGLLEFGLRMPQTKRAAYETHLSRWQNDFANHRRTKEPTLLHRKNSPSPICVEFVFAILFYELLTYDIAEDLCEWLWKQCDNNCSVWQHVKLRAGIALVLISIDSLDRSKAVIVARKVIDLAETTFTTDISTMEESKYTLAVALIESSIFGANRAQNLAEAAALCGALISSIEIRHSMAPRSMAYKTDLALALRLVGEPGKQLEAETLLTSINKDVKSVNIEQLDWSARTFGILGTCVTTLDDRVKYSKTAVETLQRRNGDDHRRTMSARARLANNLRNIGSYNVAEELISQCLINIQNSPPHDANHAWYNEIKAQVLLAQGKYDEAITCFQAALQHTRGSTKGPLIQSIKGANTLHGLSLAISATGDLDKAEQTVLVAVDICEASCFPAKLVECLISLSLIQGEQRSKDRIAEGIKTLDRALRCFTSIKQDSHLLADSNNANNSSTTIDGRNGITNLRRKIGAIYGHDILLKRAILHAKSGDIKTAKSEFRAAAISWDSIDCMAKDSAARFLDDVVKLCAYSSDSDEKSMDKMDRYAEWALIRAKEKLGQDCAIAEKIRNSKRVSFSTESTHTTNGNSQSHYVAHLFRYVLCFTSRDEGRS